jgi:hypothetical protein
VSSKFAIVKIAGSNKSLLINRDHVRTDVQSGPNVVTLGMDHGHGGGAENVEGHLDAVWREFARSDAATHACRLSRQVMMFHASHSGSPYRTPPDTDHRR